MIIKNSKITNLNNFTFEEEYKEQTNLQDVLEAIYKYINSQIASVNGRIDSLHKEEN